MNLFVFSHCFTITKLELFYLLDSSAVLAQEGMCLLKTVLQRIFCLLFIYCSANYNSLYKANLYFRLFLHF